MHKKTIDWHKICIYVISLVSIVVLVGLFQFKFLYFSHSLENVIGYDNTTHFSVIQVFKLHIFPSLWGWLPQWYAGMPFPLFYPPIPYYFASILMSGEYSADIFTYKIISEFFVVANIVLLFELLRRFFATELTERKKIIENIFSNEHWIIRGIRVFLPIIIAIGTIILANPGAPSIHALSDGIFSHQFAMFWFIVAVWCFWRGQIHHLILGALAAGITLVSNTHAFLTLCGILPFLIITTTQYSSQHIISKENISIVLQRIIRSFSFFLIGISAASFWTVPMVYFYDYFAGIHTVDIGLSNRFFINGGTILCIALVSVWISYRNKKKSFFLFFLSLIQVFIVLGCIDIVQRSLSISTHIPIQLWRWYETAFVLLVFPLAYILFKLMYMFRHVGALAILLLCIFFGIRDINWHSIYFNHAIEDASGLVKKMSSDTKPLDRDLVFVHGRGYPTYTTVRQTAIDAELGASGVQTIFSNLRESSINSVFLRIAKIMISPAEENWALINFVQNTNSDVHFIDNYYALLKFLGINTIVLGNSDIRRDQNSIDIAKSKLFTQDTSLNSFSILQSKDPQSRATQITAPLTLIFAENGFRDRKISDPTYTRFQEIAFEKKLYTRSITFNPHTLVIEENADEINKAKYIVLATLETKDINKALEVIENSLQHPDRKIFILANKAYTDEYKEFVKYFAANKQVIFVDVRNNIFPFDEVISRIIASEPFEYREDPLSIEMSNTNINISNPYMIQKQDQHVPLQSQHLTQTIWFIRQSYFPAWLAQTQDGTRVPTYLASPGYTLVFPDTNTSISLYFSTPRIVIIGHIISLIGLMTLLTITLYQYRAYYIASPKRKKNVK